ncbi:MAG: non-homologous end-joining DNA ligase [Bacillota bacterium]
MQGLKLANLDKVLWPEEGITKGQLIEYYASMSNHLLRYLRDRPIFFTRYPDGIRGKRFYQKNLPASAPSWIQTWTSPAGTRLMVAGSQRDLVWIGNQASIEIHPWFSTRLVPDCPNFVVFDLDPSPPASIQHVRAVARCLKELLDYLGLKSFPKTSGATGIHVCVPLLPAFPYEICRSFVEAVARVVRARHPELVTLNRAVATRTGKVYIDYLQVSPGKAVVSLFSPRPLPGAPVSAPFDWASLDEVDPGQFNLLNVPELFRDQVLEIERLDLYPQGLWEPINKLKGLMATFAPARRDLFDHV